MSKKLKIVPGTRYGDRVVIKEVSSRKVGYVKKHKRFILCECKCGRRDEVELSNLTRGNANKCVDCSYKVCNFGDRRGSKIVRPNPYMILGDCIRIYLDTDCKKYTIIDVEDKWVLKYVWRVVNGYAVTSNNYKNIPLHRMLMNKSTKRNVDHINMDPLDNRKSNLREASNSENLHNVGLRKTNSSGYMGVYKYVLKSGIVRWCAYISVRSKRIYLGSFDCPKVAALAYDSAKIKYMGEFARTNKMEGLL